MELYLILILLYWIGVFNILNGAFIRNFLLAINLDDPDIFLFLMGVSMNQWIIYDCLKSILND